MPENSLVDELLDLSHALGRPERQLAMLGEGNTSADCEDGTFWVKASGSRLETLDAGGLSRVHTGQAFELLDRPGLQDEEIEAGLRAVVVDPKQRKPSVETFLHALCLTEGHARWVAHTHPVSANRLLCSRLGAEPFLQHLFPDAIVVCGKIPAVVPYVDPGRPLGLALRAELRRYADTHDQAPKLILLVNHGIVALGQTATEALNITLMADKWARVLWGTYAAGGPQYLPQSEVERIDGRLDEAYRRRALVGTSESPK